jgi:hypothetical protein
MSKKTACTKMRQCSKKKKEKPKSFKNINLINLSSILKELYTWLIGIYSIYEGRYATFKNQLI